MQGISADLYGLGYSGIGYKTSGVKAIALGESESTLFDPSLDNCLTGDYPLARLLYVYVNKRPNESIDTLTYEFMRFVLSRQGQEIVVKDGYYPLPATIADSILKSLK